MSGLEITCANRNARGMITRLGGDGWTLEAHDAIVKLLSDQLQLNIRVDGRSLSIGVRGEGQDAYLALEPEGFPLHNLSDLPSC